MQISICPRPQTGRPCGQVNGSTIDIYDVTGAFNNGEQIDLIGSAITYTLDGSTGVASAGNKYFLDGVQQADLDLSLLYGLLLPEIGEILLLQIRW